MESDTRMGLWVQQVYGELRSTECTSCLPARDRTHATSLDGASRVHLLMSKSSKCSPFQLPPDSHFTATANKWRLVCALSPSGQLAPEPAIPVAMITSHVCSTAVSFLDGCRSADTWQSADRLILVSSGTHGKHTNTLAVVCVTRGEVASVPNQKSRPQCNKPSPFTEVSSRECLKVI